MWHFIGRYVSKFVKKSERTAASAEEEKFTNLYVKNLVDGITEELLEERFSRYGKIISVVIMKDDKGSSKGFGFVNFQSPDDAKKALEAMNGAQLGKKKTLVVMFLCTSSQRFMIYLCRIDFC